jgi:hypothetical protein
VDSDLVFKISFHQRCLVSLIFEHEFAILTTLVIAKIANISRGTQGWTVRMVSDGIEYSRYFRFTDGGIRKSLASVKRWCEKLLRDVGERRRTTGPRKKAPNNSSRVNGVSRSKSSQWFAIWQEHCVQRFKAFATKRGAIAYRKQQLAGHAR